MNDDFINSLSKDELIALRDKIQNRIDGMPYKHLWICGFHNESTKISFIKYLRHFSHLPLKRCSEIANNAINGKEDVMPLIDHWNLHQFKRIMDDLGVFYKEE